MRQRSMGRGEAACADRSEVGGNRRGGGVSSTARPIPGSERQFAVRVDLNSARMQLSGRLDGRTAHLLHDAVSLLLLKSSEKSWLFEVTGLDVDPAGLRALAGVYRRTLRQGRRLAV